MDSQINAREVAYHALLKSYREEVYLEHSLERSNLEGRELALARQIAYGTMRMTRTLDFLARQLASSGKLKLKLKEKTLLRMALYQHLYMDRLPLYAIVDETVQLSKKHVHKQTQRFLNATLRKLEEASFQESKELGERLSFPEFFVDQIKKDYHDQAETILTNLNTPPPITARKLGVMPPSFLPVEHLSDTLADPSLYIQNPTPAHLLHELLAEIEPATILDLCAAPGGKTLLAHDLFPDATLFANDLAENKRPKLEENFAKISKDVTLTFTPGEKYPAGTLFDLIIIDAPCSNSGVFHKRPEARWRMNKESLAELNQIQQRLIEHALTLLAPGGHLLYLTCSILKQENEGVVRHLEKEKKVRCLKQRTYLPDERFDGGYGALLSQ